MSCLQVDKLVETKGLDYMDREKAKRHAKQQAEQMYDQQYGGRDIQGGGGGNWGNLGNQYGVGGGGIGIICFSSCVLWKERRNVFMVCPSNEADCMCHVLAMTTCLSGSGNLYKVANVWLLHLLTCYVCCFRK